MLIVILIAIIVILLIVLGISIRVSFMVGLRLGHEGYFNDIKKFRNSKLERQLIEKVELKVKAGVVE